MSDGVVRREIVVGVLMKSGVDVSVDDGGYYTISRKTVATGDGRTEVIFLPAELHRNLLHRLQYRFNVPIEHFYHPDMVGVDAGKFDPASIAAPDGTWCWVLASYQELVSQKPMLMDPFPAKADAGARHGWLDSEDWDDDVRVLAWCPISAPPDWRAVVLPVSLKHVSSSDDVLELEYTQVFSGPLASDAYRRWALKQKSC